MAFSTANANIYVNTSINPSTKLLVDSGSDICLMKQEAVHDLQLEVSTMKVHGLGGNSHSLGKLLVKLYIGCHTYKQIFEVVDELPLATDGILGRNFLIQYGVNLDFDKGHFHIDDEIVLLEPERPRVFALTPETHAEAVLKVLEPAIAEVPQEIRVEFRRLLTEYADVFKLEGEPIPANNFYEQKLLLHDQTPVYVPQYRIAQIHLKPMREEVLKLLAHGIIRPSRSAYNNPNLMVPKKNGKLRMVTDFRGLNKKLVSDKYPIKRFDAIFDGMGCSEYSKSPKYFSTFDMASGFYQIPLADESCQCTAFSTEFGFFEYTRLPFGLSVAPNSFCRMMAHAFRDLTEAEGFVFMDDLVAKSDTLQGLLAITKKVFEICRKRSLSLNPYKPGFFKRRVTYFGHELTADGIYPDEQKYEVIRKYPVPKNKDDVKRFVSFASYYRRFVKSFAHIAGPLNDLTKKKSDFVWTESCQSAFDQLKENLMKPPLLVYPDFTRQFILSTDASDIALGAVLCQEYDGIDRPIHYASKSLTKGEKGKSTIEKELLAIHWAILQFKPYIYGTRFLVKSDHRPLVHLFSLRDPTSKLNRIRLEMEEHNFDIEYVKGKDNVIADALSRVSIEDLKNQNAFVLAVTTRLQAKRNLKQIQEETKSLTPVEKNKEAREEPLKREGVISTELKILEVNGFACRRYPEIIFNHGAGEVIVGYHLRKRNQKRLIRIQIEKRERKGTKNKKLGADLDKTFKKLIQAAAAKNLLKLKIRDDDELFKYYSTQILSKITVGQGPNVVIAKYKAPKNINGWTSHEKRQLIEQYHENKFLGAHSGIGRLTAKLKNEYEMKGMTKLIKQVVRNCMKCQLNKPSNKTIEQLCITETPTRANDMLSIDTVGPLPKSEEGYQYLCTVQCLLAKFATAIPMKDKTAASIAKALFEGFVYVHGFFKVLISDKGSEYVNEILTELLKYCEIEHRTSAGYRPQTIGALERNHRVLNEYLRSYLEPGRENWPQLVKSYVFAYNTTPNSTINGYTPYELVFGKVPHLPDFLSVVTPEPVYNVDNYAKTLKYQLQTAQIQAREFLLKDKMKRKLDYDTRSKPLDVEIGDKVKLINEQRTKFDPKYTGPYQIVKIKRPNVYVQKLDGKKIKKVHLDRVAKC